jgi:hypothetical protein
MDDVAGLVVTQGQHSARPKASKDFVNSTRSGVRFGSNESPPLPLVDGTSESIVDVSLDKILATLSVVHVHSSYKNEQRSLACPSLGPYSVSE